MATSLPLPFDDPAEAPALARDRAARQAAVDPRRNIVLEASAGTGKTRVLVDRYVRLLEAGVDPAHVLAITFTRKAAAEMRERIATRLRQAAGLSEARAARWRALRERLSDIAISTIDAFCLALLREFPLEADLDPGFEVADEAEALRLTTEAVERTLAVARRLAPRHADVALVLGQLEERGLADGLAALLGNRLTAARAFRRFRRGVPDPGSAESAARRLADHLCACFTERAGGLDVFLRDAPTWHSGFALLAEELRTLCAAGEAGDPLDPGWLRAVLDDVSRHFLTASGTPRDRLATTYPAASFASRQAYERHRDEVRRLAPHVAAIRATYRRDLNRVASGGVARLFRIAEAQYRRRLEEAARVDFAELLVRALRLLGRMDEFSQSRYRLEARYHHLLVDEFQDTSAAQWQLVSLLVRSWGEGQGLAHEAGLAPSIFVVGDRKQSIYGFRDADVTILGRARREVARLRPGRPVRKSIARSFRAVPALLAFANDFFAAVERVPGRRDAFRFGPRDRFPVGGADPLDPAVSLSAAGDVEAAARAITGEIERLLGSAQVRDRQSGIVRRARPGDIAVLFRSRESHREVAAALDARRIPAYVYKGLGFFDADEVRDLAALVRYLADPASDLRAAAFLRSRIVRLSDAGLQRLAPGLARALTAPEASDRAGTLDPEDRRVFEHVRTSLGRWLPLVDVRPPADLLDRIVADAAYWWEMRGPRRAQARENLKKLRGLVRRIQNRGYVTVDRLARRIEQLSAGDESNAVVDAADAVNLMTIHAAKGLEFPIVFLVNVQRGAGGRRAPVRVAVASSGATRPVEDRVSVGDFLSEDDDDSRAREREETKRLLYVAITRARERLYFSTILRDGQFRPAQGSLGEVFPPSFARVLGEAGAGPTPRIVEWSSPPGGIHRLRVLEQPEAGASVAVEGGPDAGTAPDAVAPTDERFDRLQDTSPPRVAVTGLEPGGRTAAAGSARVAEPVARSRPEGDWVRRTAALADDEDEEADRRLVGRLVHRLFQHVTRFDVLDADTLARRARALAEPGELPGAEEAGQILRRVADAYRALRQQPELQALLASGTPLFEVPFSVGTGGGIVRGTIDCLVRTHTGRLVVVELKTGAPRAGHDEQLRQYVDAVRQLMPGATVSGMLFHAHRPEVT